MCKTWTDDILLENTNSNESEKTNDKKRRK